MPHAAQLGTARLCSALVTFPCGVSIWKRTDESETEVGSGLPVRKLPDSID